MKGTIMEILAGFWSSVGTFALLLAVSVGGCFIAMIFADWLWDQIGRDKKMIDTGAFTCSPVDDKWQITVGGETKTYTHEETLEMVKELMWERPKP